MGDFQSRKFFPWVFPCKIFSLEISLESRWRPESAKVLLLEFGKQQSFALKGRILGFGTGIQLKESGIHPRLESRTKVPLSRNPKCGTRNLETMAWNPETKTVALN